jgi:hypothetical protein
MNTHQEHYLWDPTGDADSEIAELERILQPHSARALDLASRKVSFDSAVVSSRRRRRGWQLATVAMAASIAGLAVFHFYRLSWTENSPWPVTVANVAGGESSALLRVGDTVTTGPNEIAVVSAARIGTVEVAADSSVVLIQTGERRHRLELKYGRLHAKVWAPPGYFGIANRDAVAIDLGCEFEIEADQSGRGSLAVESGWVIHNHRGTEVLVPEDHTIVFDNESVGTPIRKGADAQFRALIGRMDGLLLSTSASIAERDDLAARIAATATDADQITLLSLMGRHQELTETALYGRLRAVLGDPGEEDPINQWWRRLPKQPKRWWLHWRDAF